MSRLGLRIYIGKGGQESKTEDVCFPFKALSRTETQSWINDYEESLLSDTNLPLDRFKKRRKTSLKNIEVITDRFYVKK